MKTILTIEIESPDAEQLDLFPGEELSDEDYEGKEQELLDFRKDFADKLPIAIIKRIKKFLDEGLSEDFMDYEEELLVEDWGDFEDYGVKISTKVAYDNK